MNAETEMKLEAMGDIVESLETRLDDALNHRDELLWRLNLARRGLMAIRDTAFADKPKVVDAINRILAEL